MGRSDFSLDMSKFVQLTEKKMEMVVKKSFISLSKDVILDTPVDSGRLRANWQPAINKFEDSSTIDKDKGHRKTLGKVTAEANSFKLGDTLTLTNNLAYALDIEFNGHSSVKAPQGMVRLNVIRWQEHLDKNARKLK